MLTQKDVFSLLPPPFPFWLLTERGWRRSVGPLPYGPFHSLWWWRIKRALIIAASLGDGWGRGALVAQPESQSPLLVFTPPPAQALQPYV